MQATLGTLLDRLQGFLGKAYFLAGFLPMVIFLTLNALLAAAVFPDAAERLQGVARLDAAANALTWLGLLLLAYVLGLLVWSLNPIIRQFLEGRYLPKWVKDRLTSLQQEERGVLLEARQHLMEEVWELRNATRGPGGWHDQLIAARREGKGHPVAELSAELRTTSDELQGRRKRLDRVPFQELKGLFGLLKAELAAKPADQIPELDQLRREFRHLLEFVHQSAESAFAELTSEVGIRFPRNSANVGATRLANQAEVQREYGLRRYGLDIELYWLRLQKFARADEHFFPMLEDAKTQLDFSVTTLALLTLLTVVWVPLSVWFAPTPGLFLLLFAAGPLSMWVFIHVVGQNYRAFAEAVRSAVDLYRFDLLGALHLELPANSKAERDLWTELMKATVDVTEKTQEYKHPPPGEDGDTDEGEKAAGGGQDEQAGDAQGDGR